MRIKRSHAKLAKIARFKKQKDKNVSRKGAKPAGKERDWSSGQFLARDISCFGGDEMR
jgi:hypothetical protein